MKDGAAVTIASLSSANGATVTLTGDDLTDNFTADSEYTLKWTPSYG